MNKIETGFTIQEVAKITGLSVHTLRYYERVGLLSAIDRASSGHRRYSEANMTAIEFINRLRATGMPIRQMQQYADLIRQGAISYPARLKLLQIHQEAVEAQICELEQNLAVIKKKTQLYKELTTEHENAKTG